MNKKISSQPGVKALAAGAAAGIMKMAIDRLPELANPDMAAAAYASLAISGAANTLQWAIDKWKEKLQVDKIEVNANFDSAWKIAGKSAMKGRAMREHWNKLLLAAIDPEFDHAVTLEDIEFIDTLNPADALIIKALTHPYAGRAELFKKQEYGYTDLFRLIRLNQDEQDYYTQLLENYIPAKAMGELYHGITGTVTKIQESEIEVSFARRVNKWHRPDNATALFDVKGWHELGHVYYPSVNDQSRPFARKVWGENESGRFVIGRLTYNATRLGSILNNVRYGYDDVK